jgi:hypothetical protein
MRPLDQLKRNWASAFAGPLTLVGSSQGGTLAVHVDRVMLLAPAVE